MGKLATYKKVDRMDGKIDGKFFGTNLVGKLSLIGKCDPSSATNARVKTTKGVVDCGKLWGKLKALTDIAFKAPFIRYAVAVERALKTGKVVHLQGVSKPQGKDVAFHTIVTMMVSALLTQKVKPSANFKALFGSLRTTNVFTMIGKIYAKYAKIYGTRRLATPRTMNDLYALMVWAGKRYGFSPKSFKPGTKSRSARPAPRPAPRRAAPNRQPQPLPRQSQPPAPRRRKVYHF